MGLLDSLKAASRAALQNAGVAYDTSYDTPTTRSVIPTGTTSLTPTVTQRSASATSPTGGAATTGAPSLLTKAQKAASAGSAPTYSDNQYKTLAAQMGIGTGAFRQDAANLADIKKQVDAKLYTSPVAVAAKENPPVSIDTGYTGANAIQTTNADQAEAGYWKQQALDMGLGSASWRQNADISEIKDVVQKASWGLPYTINYQMPGTGTDINLPDRVGTSYPGMKYVQYADGTWGWATDSGDPNATNYWGSSGVNTMIEQMAGAGLNPMANGYIPGVGPAPGLQGWYENYDTLRGQYRGYAGYLDATYPGGYAQWQKDYGNAQAESFGVTPNADNSSIVGGGGTTPGTTPGDGGSGDYNPAPLGDPYTTHDRLLYDPYTGHINWQTETTQGQLENMLAENSPLLERTRQQALEQANARGLLNSSMAMGAATNAVIDQAKDIAASDASAYRNQALQNQSDINTALRDIFGAESGLAQIDRQSLWQQSAMRLEGAIKADLATLDASLAVGLEEMKQKYGIYLENLKLGGEASNTFANQAATLYDGALRSISNIGAQDLTPEQYARAVDDIIASLDKALAFNAAIYGMDYTPGSGTPDPIVTIPPGESDGTNDGPPDPADIIPSDSYG
jgi:hypothetical protein